MIHDSGQATGRMERMRRRFPNANLVIFGHSHIPMDAEQNGLRIFNPGSPTDKRRQPLAAWCARDQRWAATRRSDRGPA